MVVQQPSKLMMRVRFPLPAPARWAGALVPLSAPARWAGALALALLAFTPIAAVAAPVVIIRGAAVRVTVIPQNRRVPAVMVLQTNRALPLSIRQQGGRLMILGNVSRQVHACGGPAAPGGVSLKGRGVIPYAALPRLVIYTPMNVRLQAGDAVFGVIGRSASVELDKLGCGDWTIADARGRLHIDQAGAGVTRTGAAGTADLAVAGSGRISVRTVGRALTAISSGSGVLEVGAMSGGPADLRIAGTGDIRIDRGEVGSLNVSTAGSGEVRADVTAASLSASVTGSGDVWVRRVVGPVTRRTFGRGRVMVGP